MSEFGITFIGIISSDVEMVKKSARPKFRNHDISLVIGFQASKP